MKHSATVLQCVGATSAVAAGACHGVFWALVVLAVVLLAFGIAAELG